MDDYENPIEGKTYISPRLPGFLRPDVSVRIATKLIDSEESYAFAKIKDEIVLRYNPGGSKKIIAKFIEDPRGIFVLNIQAYTAATGNPHSASFSFRGEEIGKLLEFARNIQAVKFQTSGGEKISDEELNNLVLSDQQAINIYNDNEELFSELVKSNITTKDIIAVGYRKNQLEIFNKLIFDDEYFEDQKNIRKCKNEALWQQYFEQNSWVFGYGLGYIFLTGLDDKKLEQIVQGYDIQHKGKRVDAVMKTKGLISNLCFVELKTHFTPLLESKPYRSGCWAPSRELSGAVAQVQGTVSSAIEGLSNSPDINDKEGNPTGEKVFNYQPKSYLVIGNLEEFTTEHGVNKEKLRSFELFRKNTTNPEIITFDELYERAKFIVHNNENN